MAPTRTRRSSTSREILQIARWHSATSTPTLPQAKPWIDIATPLSSNLSLALFDILGKKVAEVTHPMVGGERRSTEIPTANVAPGLYLVRISNGTTTEVR